PTPNPDRGEPTPNPDRGEPTPNPDRGEPTPNPSQEGKKEEERVVERESFLFALLSGQNIIRTYARFTLKTPYLGANGIRPPQSCPMASSLLTSA
ncbi:MAG: hypothetical protein SWX82_33665, partial [Cyanobacteriota bacterium]|nr:hypothetical protein [Cyanobacteriota bacterium]